MKICCDLCNGTLQMNASGQDATCLSCGMTYTLERLRRMLNPPMVQPSVSPMVQPSVSPMVHPPVTPVVQPSVTPVVQPPLPFGMTGQAPVSHSSIPQFIMDVTSGKGDVFTGVVRQGGVGVGDTVYINNDYSRPYTVLGDGGDLHSVTQGGRRLELVTCPKNVAKTARIITGVPNPVESAYNYQGAVLSYFEKVLSREFSDYQLENAVPCGGVKKPVTFLLSKNGQPKVAVFVIDRENSSERYAVEKAAQVLEPYGIGVTHFFEAFRNDAPYVVARIRAAMK